MRVIQRYPIHHECDNCADLAHDLVMQCRSALEKVIADLDKLPEGHEGRVYGEQMADRLEEELGRHREARLYYTPSEGLA